MANLEPPISERSTAPSTDDTFRRLLQQQTRLLRQARRENAGNAFAQPPAASSSTAAQSNAPQDRSRYAARQVGQPLDATPTAAKKDADAAPPSQTPQQQETQPDPVNPPSEIENQRELQRAKRDDKQKPTDPKKPAANANPKEVPGTPAPAAAVKTMLSKKLLRLSWLSLIETFGLTLIYINFHFVMKYMGGSLGQYFCKFGEEWASKQVPVGGAIGQSSKIQLWEILAMFLLDCIAAVIALLILGSVFIVFYSYYNFFTGLASALKLVF